MVVLKGDVVEFSSVGYKTIDYKIPDSTGNQYGMIQLMVTDAQYLPATIIKPRPTREQFERDFVSTTVPDDDIEIARQNNSAAKRAVLSAACPPTPVSRQYYLRQNAQKYYYRARPRRKTSSTPSPGPTSSRPGNAGDFEITIHPPPSNAPPPARGNSNSICKISP